MLFAYLKVLVPGQRNQSCLRLGEGLLKYRPIVVYVGLDAPMVVHLGDVLPTSCGSRPIRLGLKSFFGLEKISAYKTDVSIHYFNKTFNQ